MKNDRNYFADTSFLIDLIHERNYAVNIMENSDKVITSSLCAYELGKKICFDFTTIEEAFIQPFNLKDSIEASKIFREMEAKGNKINKIDQLIAAQARRLDIPVLTVDKDFKKVEDLETVYYRN